MPTMTLLRKLANLYVSARRSFRTYAVGLAVGVGSVLSIGWGTNPDVIIDTSDPTPVTTINQNADTGVYDRWIHIDRDEIIISGSNFIQILGNKIKLTGNGNNSTILRGNLTNTPSLLILIKGNNSEISDLSFDGDRGINPFSPIGIQYNKEGNNYGEVKNIIRNCFFRNFSKHAVEWQNYQRMITSPAAIDVSDCEFDNLFATAVNYNEVLPATTTEYSPYIDFINCTFNDIHGDQSVAADLPFINLGGGNYEFLGTFDSCVISGATQAFNESIYFSNSPTNNAKTANPGHYLFSGDLEDVAFTDIMGGGDEGNIIANPNYFPDSLRPMNPALIGSNYSRGFAGAVNPGDLNGDRACNLEDFVVFANELLGPGVPSNLADLDGDGDTDLKDFNLFSEVYKK